MTVDRRSLFRRRLAQLSRDRRVRGLRRPRAPCRWCRRAADGPATVTRDTHEDLHAVLWMQTAAEYRALATAIYARAVPVARQGAAGSVVDGGHGADRGVRVAPACRDPRSRRNRPRQLRVPGAAGARPARPSPRPRGRTGCARGRQAPCQARRRSSTRSRSAACACSTSATAPRRRKRAPSRTCARSASRRPVIGCCRPASTGWTTDKSPRRAFVAEHYRVLMLVGDDLGDFVAIARLSPAEREALADRYADRWLERWVLLPNAVVWIVAPGADPRAVRRSRGAAEEAGDRRRVPVVRASAIP